LSAANNIAQQSMKTVVRSGYPLSSELVNDAFDALLYDLLEVLTTDKVYLSDITKQILEGISVSEAASFRLGKEFVEEIIDDHTTNWRHI